jgi:group I intron endonuclease
MKFCGVYGIRNSINGKWYIGESVNIKYRKSKHFSTLKYNCHKNDYLQRSWNKYGKEVFEFIILELCLEESLEAKEKEWIAKYKSNDFEYGYNLTDGGNVGKKMKEESKSKLSDSIKKHWLFNTHPMLGKNHTQEAKNKIAAGHFGKPLSDEHKKKLAKASIGNTYSLGHKHTDEAKAKMSKARKGKKKSKEHMRKIIEGIKKTWQRKKALLQLENLPIN